MLEIRPSCEHCDTALPFDSEEAMICTFECTFCVSCVETVLEHLCPNCGGDFQPRPIRPAGLLEKYPVSSKRVHKVVDLDVHKKRLNERGQN